MCGVPTGVERLKAGSREPREHEELWSDHDDMNYRTCFLISFRFGLLAFDLLLHLFVFRRDERVGKRETVRKPDETHAIPLCVTGLWQAGDKSPLTRLLRFWLHCTGCYSPMPSAVVKFMQTPNSHSQKRGAGTSSSLLLRETPNLKWLRGTLPRNDVDDQVQIGDGANNNGGKDPEPSSSSSWSGRPWSCLLSTLPRAYRERETKKLR